MLDAAMDTEWKTTSISNQFVKIQLAASYMLEGVRIAPRFDVANSTESVKGFELWTSTTSSNDADFSLVYQGTILNNQKVQEFRFAAPVPARYVKYVPKTNYGSTSIISTGYFELMAQEAAGVVQTSSEKTAGTDSSQLLDGSNSTLWTSASGSNANQTVTIRSMRGKRTKSTQLILLRPTTPRRSRILRSGFHRPPRMMLFSPGFFRE